MIHNDPSPGNTRIRRGFWMMGALVLIPAVLFPPRSLFYRLLIEDLNLKSLFPYLMHYYPMPGGLIGQLINYSRLAEANSPEAGDFLVALVASCLATLSLTLCMMHFWRLLVDRTPRLTLWRVLLAVLVTVGSSLMLTLLLCFLEFAATTALFNSQDLSLTILVIMILLFIAQLLFVPFLFIGGSMLVKWQARAESRATAQVG